MHTRRNGHGSLSPLPTLLFHHITSPPPSRLRRRPLRPLFLLRHLGTRLRAPYRTKGRRRGVGARLGGEGASGSWCVASRRSRNADLARLMSGHHLQSWTWRSTRRSSTHGPARRIITCASTVCSSRFLLPRRRMGYVLSSRSALRALTHPLPGNPRRSVNTPTNSPEATPHALPWPLLRRPSSRRQAARCSGVGWRVRSLPISLSSFCSIPDPADPHASPRRARLYSPISGKPLAVLSYHRSSLHALAFAPLPPSSPPLAALDAQDSNSDSEEEAETPVEQGWWKRARPWLAVGGKDERISLWEVYPPTRGAMVER